MKSLLAAAVMAIALGTASAPASAGVWDDLVAYIQGDYWKNGFPH